MTNYFELFDIPVSFLPDNKVVKRKYFELSKKFHPDYFAQAGEEEQAEALEVSAQINKGIKTFGSNDATIKYLLELKGLLIAEEKYILPPDFLMEVMDINEEADDLKSDPIPAKTEELKQQLLTLEKELYEPVADIIEGYQESVTTEKELLQVKDYYFKRKYLSRVHEALNGMS